MCCNHGNRRPIAAISVDTCIDHLLLAGRQTVNGPERLSLYPRRFTGTLILHTILAVLPVPAAGPGWPASWHQSYRTARQNGTG